jgi:putative SOS response-associated peptidase YedK
MCGRYNLTANSEAIVEHFQLLRQVKFNPVTILSLPGKFSMLSDWTINRVKPSICFGA